MNNHITASIEFYYKGEKLSPLVELDLDYYMQKTGCLPELYGLLAQSMNIGIYSYEYEMLLAEPIRFSDAEGMAQQYLCDGFFDVESFQKYWKESIVLEKLKGIARKYLSVDDLNKQEGIESALIEAYRLGQDAEQK